MLANLSESKGVVIQVPCARVNGAHTHPKSKNPEKGRYHTLHSLQETVLFLTVCSTLVDSSIMPNT
jgi:hypothetical protein